MPKIVILGSCRHAPYEILAMPNKLDEELYKTDHEQAYDLAFRTLFKQAILEADLIIVYAPDGIGQHTWKDMIYARSVGKRMVIV